MTHYLKGLVNFFALSVQALREICISVEEVKKRQQFGVEVKKRKVRQCIKIRG